MGRSGDFSRGALEQASARQDDRCAYCEQPFSEYDAVAGHHITSVEAGLQQGWTPEQIGSVDNCAMVHANSPYEDAPACHWEAHGYGQYGKVDAPSEMFTLNAEDMAPLNELETEIEAESTGETSSEIMSETFSETSEPICESTIDILNEVENTNLEVESCFSQTETETTTDFSPAGEGSDADGDGGD